LSSTADVEILKTMNDAGTGSLNLTGSNIANTITGNNGANRLDGGSAGDDGATDVLNGLLGNDVYVLGAGNDTINDTGGIDTIESSVTRSLASYATIEKLTLTGSGAANATGNALNNVLTGNTGNNIITGGAGNDTMVGGVGNDTFVFDASGADIITDFGAKYFTLSMSGSNVVTPTASTATATGGAVMNLGNTRLQLDIATSGLDWRSTTTETNKVTAFGFYQGAAGANGTLSHDILADTSTYKSINTSTGAVRDIWTTANDLTSTLATSILAGGHYLEIDTTAFNTPGAIRGQLTANGTSADVISVAALNISDFATIQELAYNSGTSVIIKRISNSAQSTLTLQNTNEADLLAGHFTFSTSTTVDNLTGTAGADDMFGAGGNDILNGAAGNDRLFGETGNDSLVGGTGNDRMFGGVGNDTYVVDTTGDYINDTSGTDTIQTSVNYSLVNLTAIENLMTTSAAGTTNLTLWGNASANQITGNAGNNIIDGKAGNDTMTGLAGNDTYFVDSASDSIVDSAGTDTVKASITYTLGAGLAVEVLQAATTTAAINLTGNELAQRVIGSNMANTINGGLGNDTLTGSGGNDNFLFNTALNSTTNRDTITDYNTIADTIRLENTGIFTALGTGTLSASRFVVGTAALDSADRIIYNKTTGVLSYDADGSGAGAAIQFAVLTNKATLTNADFVII
jgi:Ca2+-binding RTX toxin-like protein